MRDYRRDGFNDGYGKKRDDDGDYPQNDGDVYSYRRGYEDGQRRREIANELERNYFNNEATNDTDD